jgi:hypothetical protein
VSCAAPQHAGATREGGCVVYFNRQGVGAMKRIVSICVIAALTCVSWAQTTLGGEGPAFQTYEFPIAFTFYAWCIDDYVSVDGTIYGRVHEFETKSGVVQVVDNVTYQYVASDTSGREWYVIGTAFTQSSVRVEKGMVTESIDVARFVPITEDTPQLMYRWRINMTVNANGELVVTTDDWSIEAALRCLPQKK